jgi:hypothetical protein
MSGARRLSLEWDRETSFLSLRSASELNFGVITLALLALGRFQDTWLASPPCGGLFFARCAIQLTSALTPPS